LLETTDLNNEYTAAINALNEL